MDLQIPRSRPEIAAWRLRIRTFASTRKCPDRCTADGVSPATASQNQLV